MSGVRFETYVGLPPRPGGFWLTADTLLAVASTAVGILAGLYLWLLPKPIPGIPYNKAAVRSLLGDVPDMVQEVKQTGEFRVWCAKQVVKMESPICQVFIRPFSKPWILLADFRESKDILTRRKEFDKSSFLSDGMACMGAFHGIYVTGDKFRWNRQLIQDLMTTSFLSNHMGPVIYKKASELVLLFDKKARLASGKPFAAKKDFEHASLDVMLEFAFGSHWSHTATGAQLEMLSTLENSRFEVDGAEEAITFPVAPLPEFLKSVYEAPEIVEKTINSIVPKLQTWWWSRQSWYRKTFDVKDQVMREQVNIALENCNKGQVRTGLEHMLAREKARAEKAARRPDFDNPVFRDEMFGDIVGGHHTTSGAMMWLAKYLSDFPEVQTNLREVLHETMPQLRSERRLFTLEEIRQAKLPYLDAVIEEMLRINAVTVTREAMCDTTILGYPVKRGTQVFFVSNGPGFLSPSMALDNSRRSDTSRAAKLNDTWDESRDLSEFDPTRWLVRKVQGDGLLEADVGFDGAAGPQLVFGLGPRACWGRRLAIMEIRLMISMLVVEFELLTGPPSLSTYAGLEGIARVPQQCFLKLRKI